MPPATCRLTVHYMFFFFRFPLVSPHLYNVMLRQRVMLISRAFTVISQSEYTKQNKFVFY